MTNKEWFPTAKFGLMIHFGLYSIPAGEWKGKRTNQIGEWLQAYYRIPNAEYSQLATVFNPILFNAEEWVLTAKEAGMQYMVVTSKHHEGFALFQSEWDNFNSADGTPFGRDIIAELAEACYKHGLKLGLYYSQEIDWHEPDGGGMARGYTHVGANGGYGEKGCSWTNDWDFPDNDKKDFSRCFEGKIKTQFKEILTKYGDLCLIWCDTPSDITPAQSDELYAMIKKYQPDCLVNSRIGNGIGDYHSCGDNQVDFKKAGNTSAVVGGRTGLYECPATLNTTWGYKSFDNEWKDPAKVIEIKNRLNAQNINYLLNVGPDYLGRIPAPAQEILRAVGQASN
ncbi:MAG: alpha-L-fucosidase [Clostridia bacterium]|nr:alpha-L-fucosidase [Clostridia bacterium]